MDPGGVDDGHTKSDIEWHKFQLGFQEAFSCDSNPFPRIPPGKRKPDRIHLEDTNEVFQLPMVERIGCT